MPFVPTFPPAIAYTFYCRVYGWIQEKHCQSSITSSDINSSRLCGLPPFLLTPTFDDPSRSNVSVHRRSSHFIRARAHCCVRVRPSGPRKCTVPFLKVHCLCVICSGRRVMSPLHHSDLGVLPETSFIDVDVVSPVPYNMLQ